MFCDILERGFDGMGLRSDEDFKIMSPQHSAAPTMVRAGQGGCGWQQNR